MATTPFEDGVTAATAGIGDYIEQGWPYVVAAGLGLLGFKWFRRILNKG